MFGVIVCCTAHDVGDFKVCFDFFKEIDIYHTQQKISTDYEEKIVSAIKYIRDRKQRPDVDTIFKHKKWGIKYKQRLYRRQYDKTTERRQSH